jgi:hypothetical protein
MKSGPPRALPTPTTALTTNRTNRLEVCDADYKHAERIMKALVLVLAVLLPPCHVHTVLAGAAVTVPAGVLMLAAELLALAAGAVLLVRLARRNGGFRVLVGAR